MLVLHGVDPLKWMDTDNLGRLRRISLDMALFFIYGESVLSDKHRGLLALKGDIPFISTGNDHLVQGLHS